MSVPICELCDQPLGDRAVPWQRVDPRYPSGAVLKLTWVHRECLPKDEPPKTAA